MKKMFSREGSKSNVKGKPDNGVPQEQVASTQQTVIGEAKAGKGNGQPPISSSSTRTPIYDETTPVKKSGPDALNPAATEYVPGGKPSESSTADVVTTVLPKELLELKARNEALQLELQTRLDQIELLQKSVDELSAQNAEHIEHAQVLRQRATDAAVAFDEHDALLKALDALKAEKAELATTLARQEEAYHLDLTAKGSTISSMRQESEEQYSALSQAFEQYKQTHPVMAQIEEKDQAGIEQPESEHATIILQLQRELEEKALEINLLKEGHAALHLTSEEDEPERRAQLESEQASMIQELQTALEEIKAREAQLVEEAKLKLDELTQRLIAQQLEASESINHLDQLLNEKTLKINSLQDSHAAKLLELSDQMDTQVQQFEALNQELLDARRVIDSKENELNSSDAYIGELKEEKQSLMLANDEAQVEIERLVSIVDELQCFLDQKDKDLKEYQDEIEPLIEEREETIRQLEAKIQQMQLSILELQSALRLKAQETHTIFHESENEEYDDDFGEEPLAESHVDNSVVETQANTILQHQLRIAELEQEAHSSSQALNKATEDAASLRQQLSIARLTERPIQQPASAAFFTNSQTREKKAMDAIADLEKEIVVGSLTNRDKAIQAIVDRLKESLSKDDPQAYFNEHKEDLRRQLGVLNNWKSVLCTAVNAIVTVLAVLSVVGITALWLTGNLKNNATKNGSPFAFYVADKQKGNRAIQEVTEALSCRVGG